jgi:TPR repeat protein
MPLVLDYASFAIAYCYHSGCDDFDINLDKAIYWYKINFEDSGHIAAGFELAKIYTCQKQYQKAFKIFQQVLQDGHICILFYKVLMLYLSLF